MSDNDLIRRRDVIAALTNLPIFSEHLSDAENSRAVSMIYKAQREVAALEPAPVTLADALQVPEVRALVGALRTLLIAADGESYADYYDAIETATTILSAIGETAK